jgi:hypothetical protein
MSYVAIRPLRVEELAEILALDFDGAEGATPKLKRIGGGRIGNEAVLSSLLKLDHPRRRW